MYHNTHFLFCHGLSTYVLGTVINALNALFMCIRSVFPLVLDFKNHAGVIMKKKYLLPNIPRSLKSEY